MSIEYRGYKIRKSGKDFLKVYDVRRGIPLQPRIRTFEAAKALIDACAEYRVLTPAEHALVHNTTQRREQTTSEETFQFVSKSIAKHTRDLVARLIKPEYVVGLVFHRSDGWWCFKVNRRDETAGKDN